jgi:Protein of unknown function (DUF429)
MKTLGVDFATEPSRTAGCVIDWSPGRARVVYLEAGLDDGGIIALAASDVDKVGIDCPFGWPVGFVEAVTCHDGGHAWPGREAPDPAAFRRLLSLRETDRYVQRELGKTPLSVSANLIGATAMRLAGLLDRLATLGEVVDRSGVGRFAEVYPSAALLRWGLPSSGYKGRAGRTERTAILDGLLSLVAGLDVADQDADRCRKSDDMLDSLVASLAARAAWLGLTDTPPANIDATTLAREGWMHIPIAGSATELCTPGTSRGAPIAE